MSKYKMEDGTILDTDKAKQVWEEKTEWNGNNFISVNTGSQWEHETLYLSSKGRYYLESSSQWQGSGFSAAFVTSEEAAAWLVLNNKELPAELMEHAADITE